jgi:hypothetical protein
MATKTTTKPKDETDFWNQKVTIRLPLNPGNPDDQTQYVSVGDYRAQIQRGQDVMVPRNVARVIEQSEEAELEAYKRRTAMNREYEQDAAKYR